MGGRGSGSGKGLGNSKSNDIGIVNPSSLISEREGNPTAVDQTLAVAKDVLDEYGEQIGDLEIGTFIGKGSGSVLAVYGGGVITVNANYFNKPQVTQAYTELVERGFHPPFGNKTPLQSTVSHEFGHALNDAVANKMGVDLDEAARRIVIEAIPKITKERASANISGYAAESNAECVAEAYCDVYCNGDKASADSRAIVNVLNKYLKS